MTRKQISKRWMRMERAIRAERDRKIAALQHAAARQVAQHGT